MRHARNIITEKPVSYLIASRLKLDNPWELTEADRTTIFETIRQELKLYQVEVLALSVARDGLIMLVHSENKPMSAEAAIEFHNSHFSETRTRLARNNRKAGAQFAAQLCDISHFVRAFFATYSRLVNLAHGTPGLAPWQDRYSSGLVDDLLAAALFVETDCLRSNEAKDPATYPWCTWNHLLAEKHLCQAAWFNRLAPSLDNGSNKKLIENFRKHLELAVRYEAVCCNNHRLI